MGVSAQEGGSEWRLSSGLVVGVGLPDGRGERQVSKVSLELAGPKGVRKAVRRVGDPGPQMPAVNLRRGPLQGSELSAHI